MFRGLGVVARRGVLVRIRVELIDGSVRVTVLVVYTVVKPPDTKVDPRWRSRVEPEKA
jgi:hypothetical protein